jgi:hypothetical protein
MTSGGIPELGELVGTVIIVNIYRRNFMISCFIAAGIIV